MSVNLLIVEADNFFRKNLAQRLPDDKKWQISFADHQIEAIQVIAKKNIDVVLLGLKELKKEGLMILREIKQIRPLTEVITINRPDQIALSIEVMKLGAFDDFIVPFDLESLVLRIQEAYRQKRKNEASLKTSTDAWGP